MSRQRLTVVLSQAQGKDPRKRSLEESIAAALIMEPGLDVSIVPYLYDLDADHTGRLFLESVQGDMVVLGGCTRGPPSGCSTAATSRAVTATTRSRRRPRTPTTRTRSGEPEPPKGVGAVNVPDRWIYCLDLRDHADFAMYVQEVRRIAAECRERRETQSGERQPRSCSSAGCSSSSLAPARGRSRARGRRSSRRKN